MGLDTYAFSWVPSLLAVGLRQKAQTEGIFDRVVRYRVLGLG